MTSSPVQGVLCVFRVCFGTRLENKEHPKTQHTVLHTLKHRFAEQSIICVFGCVALRVCFISSAYLRAIEGGKFCGEFFGPAKKKA